MNKYPNTSAYFRMGVASAISTVALSTTSETVEARSYEAIRQQSDSGGSYADENRRTDIGNFALMTIRDDKYATKNLPHILKRIGGCETRNSPTAKIDYRAQNPTSSASGGFQFMYGTWNNFMGYDEAWKAPHRVQNKKAIITYKKYGTKPWYASRSCWD